MNLYFDLDTGNFTSGPGIRDQVSTLTLKRGTTVPIALRFLTAGIVTELASGATGILGLKALGNYDGDYLAAALSWTKTGTGLATVYTFALNLSTTALNAVLGVGAGADVPATTANLELQFTAAGVTSKSNTVLATINNDIIRGSEAGIIEIAGGTPQNFAAATGVLTLTANPTNGETVTIGGTVYTFVPGSPAAYQVTIGGLATGSIDNLILAINMVGGNPGTTHGAAGVANAYVTASAGAGDTLNLTAINPGTAANSVATTETLANGSWAAPTLTGGTGTAGGLGSMVVDATYLYIVASVASGIPTWKKIALSAL